MSEVLAVCGKGGVGKTTISALLVRLLSQQHRVLAVDADPAGGLSMALGWRPARTLDDLRREIAADGGRSDAADLAATVDYRLLETVEQRDHLALLAVGRPEEAGCYCALNTLLRESLADLIQRFDVTVIDAEAGLEQVNRRVLQSVDRLFLVSDPTARGLRVAEELAALAEQAAGAPRVAWVLNRVRAERDAEELASRAGLPLAGTIPEDPAVRDHDRDGRSLLELPECPALDAVRNIL